MPVGQLPNPSRASRVFATVACGFAVVGLIAPIPCFWDLYHAPVGTAVRPMGCVAGIFFAGLGTPFIVLPFAIVAIVERGSSRIAGLLALALSALPLPLYYFLLDWIMDAHSLTPKP